MLHLQTVVIVLNQSIFIKLKINMAKLFMNQKLRKRKFLSQKMSLLLLICYKVQLLMVQVNLLEYLKTGLKYPKQVKLEQQVIMYLHGLLATYLHLLLLFM